MHVARVSQFCATLLGAAMAHRRTPELLASAIPSPPQSRFDTADFTERVRVNHQTLSGPLVFTLPASNFVAILRPDWFNGTDQTAVPAKTCGWGWGLVLEESGPKGIESGKGYATNQELSKALAPNLATGRAPVWTANSRKTW